MSSIVIAWFAPGTTMIEFSPSSLTPIKARPVGSLTTCTAEISTSSFLNAARKVSPAWSLPNAPIKAVLAPAREAAIAWLAPLPPQNSKLFDHVTVSPGFGNRGVRATRSKFADPTTTTSNELSIAILYY